MRTSLLRVGVHVEVKTPSPAARSGVTPLSPRVITSPPESLTVTGPAAASQLMLRADRVTGVPTVRVAGDFSTEKTGLPEQVKEPSALIRLPVMVLPYIMLMSSPPDRRRFLVAIQSLAGFCARISAARPVT